MGSNGTKWITIAALIVILACFLPWWALFSEAIPSGYDRTYTLFWSTPIFGDLQTLVTIFTPNSNVFDLLTINSGFLDRTITGPIALLISVILTLLGGIIGIISMRKKKIALIGGLLAVVGVVLYAIFIALGILPSGVDPAFFESNNLNPLFGTLDRTIGSQLNHIFGLSLGWLLSLIFGFVLLFAAFKGEI